MNLPSRIEKLAAEMEDLRAILGNVPDRRELQNCSDDYAEILSLPEMCCYSTRSHLYGILTKAVAMCDFLVAEMEDGFAQPLQLVDTSFPEPLKREDTDGN